MELVSTYEIKNAIEIVIARIEETAKLSDFPNNPIFEIEKEGAEYASNLLTSYNLNELSDKKATYSTICLDKMMFHAIPTGEELQEADLLENAKLCGTLHAFSEITKIYNKKQAEQLMTLRGSVLLAMTMKLLLSE